MPKLGMETVRRRQLVNATLRLIHRRGVAGTSVAQISARAGLATGMVHHYFADKDALFKAALEELVKRIHTQVFELLKQAKTPLERVVTFVEGNLTPLSFTEENVAAWLAFWALVPHSPPLRRLNNIVTRQTQATLFHALIEIMPRDAAREHARAITIFLDGLWLRAAVDVGGMTREAARNFAHEFLSRQLNVPLEVIRTTAEEKLAVGRLSVDQTKK
jgi:TetR/AcrR family transcriptional regulator, transcriptional repressor of bet genes